MIAVFLVYLLLAAPVRGSVHAAACGLEGEALVGIRLAGVEWVHHTTVTVGENGWPLSALPIWGAPEQKGRAEKKRPSRLAEQLESLVRQTARIDQLQVSLRIGLGDAWQTALAAGGARAAAFSALSFLPAPPDTQVRVIPDFVSPCFCAHLRCIFSITVGDIILKAAHATMKRAARKGKGHGTASH